MTLQQRLTRCLIVFTVALLAVTSWHGGRALEHAARGQTRVLVLRNARLATTALRDEACWSSAARLESTAGALTEAIGAPLRLYSPEGALLFDGDRRRVSPRPAADPDEQARVLLHGFGSTIHSDAGRVELEVALPVINAGRTLGVLRIAMPYPAYSGYLRAGRWFSLGLGLVAVAAAILIAAWLAGGVLGPLARFSVFARRLGEGDLSARIEPLPDGDLMQPAIELNGAVEALAGRLDASFSESSYYEAVLEQMTDAVVVIDERRRIRFVNRAFSRLMGIEAEDAVGNYLENIGINYDFASLLVRAVEQRNAQRDKILLRGSADTRTLVGVAAPLKSPSGATTGAVGLYHDVTDLQRAEQIRRDFVSNASHELRTPAAGVKALAEALQAGAIDDPEKGPRFVERIIETADRLGAILDDMLTLTRVERGEELLQPEWVGVTGAFADAVLQVQPAAAMRGVVVERDCAAADTVFADVRGLQTVLVNLLDNAVKYTHSGGRVTLTGAAVPRGYEITVSDTGVGIPEEDLSRIFERFYRVDKARDRATGGTGLGLAIVKHIVEAHGGRITVESRIDAGSAFTFVLPSPSA